MAHINKHLLIALTVFIVEILVATVFSHMRFIRSFIGDYLVVILIYHLVKGFRDFPPLTLAVGVFIFSCGIEIAQYFQLADWLGLERGGVLRVIIGSSFSWLDILMYLLGCVTSYGLDVRFLSKHQSGRTAF